VDFAGAWEHLCLAFEKEHSIFGTWSGSCGGTDVLGSLMFMCKRLECNEILLYRLIALMVIIC
jgi:hypothetical protein